MMEEILRDLASLDLGDCVVDVGAGFGNATRHLLSRGLVVYAVDIDPAAVASLADTFRQFVEVGLLKVVHGDAESLPLPDNFCDSAVAVALLHHVKNPERALSEMLRVARRLAVAYDWTPESAGLTNPHSPGELAHKMDAALKAAARLGFQVETHRLWYRVLRRKS